MEPTNLLGQVALDSRPMFNGEYKAFVTLLGMQKTNNGFLSIGARDDEFYLDLLAGIKCILVEPDQESAEPLIKYVNKWSIPSVIVEVIGIHPWQSSVDINNHGSIFNRKSQGDVLEALQQGIIVCPYTEHAIRNNTYEKSSFCLRAPCISPSQLLDKHSFLPDFVKIDIEGAESIIIENLFQNNIFPNFIQYEYGVTWFHAGESLSRLYQLSSNYYHYIITKKGILYVEEPPKEYFYSNWIASKYYLGHILEFRV
jgi:hypothetical protein